MTNQTNAIDYSLDAMAMMIDPERFVRANRKYIVQIDSKGNMHILSKSKIKAALILLVEEVVIISFNRSRDFKNWLNK